MYNFIDVTEASGGMVLPSEALQINGSYIEDQISGYRTLSVQGREALSPELETFETGVRDGSTLKSKRYPARIITVKYQLIAESNEAFREAYNKLGGILDVENAQLIFNDEQDKYFTGTPCGIEAVEPGRNAVVGTFDILCIDPFKYSLYEYEAQASQDEKCIYVDYGGTYKAHPKLVVEFLDSREVQDDGETGGTISPAGDCGYVAFFNEDKKIIQLGNPAEVDGENAYAVSQALINQTFVSDQSWGTTAKNLWTVNQGHIMASNVTQEGSVAMKPSDYDITNISGQTSAVIYDNTWAAGVHWHVKAFTKNRTASTVTLTIQVGGTDKSGKNEAGQVNFCVNINGKSYFMVFFKGKNAAKTQTNAVSVTITGLAASTTELPAVTVSATGVNKSIGVFSATSTSKIPVSRYSTSSAVLGYYLTPNAYGTTAAGWHGPSIRRKISKDASGIEGAQNFTLTYRQKMCIGNSTAAQNQVGSFRMNVTDSNGKNIAGVWVYKNKAGKSGKLVFFVNGVQENITDIDIHYGNDFFGVSEETVCTTTITKFGGAINFAVGSYKRSFYDADLIDSAALHVTFSFEKYGELTPLEYNGLYWAKFVKNNCNTWKDIPNIFSANDVVEADCRNAEITLNGILSPELGALGNNWESFVLKPGLNQIGYAYSEWVTDEYAPTFKVKYREVFL